MPSLHFRRTQPIMWVIIWYVCQTSLFYNRLRVDVDPEKMFTIVLKHLTYENQMKKEQINVCDTEK